MNVRLASIATTAAIAATAAIGIAAPANAAPSASGLRPAPVPAAPVPAEPVDLQVEDVDADHSMGLIVPTREIETTTEVPAQEAAQPTPAHHSAPAHVETHVNVPAPVIEAVIEAVIEDEHAASTKSTTPIAASEQSPVEEVIAAVKTKRTKSGAVSKIRIGVGDSLKKGAKVAAKVCTDNGCAETTGKVREKKYGKILVLNLKAPKFEKVLDTANSDSITITVKGHSVTV